MCNFLQFSSIFYMNEITTEFNQLYIRFNNHWSMKYLLLCVIIVIISTFLQPFPFFIIPKTYICRKIHSRKKGMCNETQRKTSIIKKNMYSKFFWDRFIRYHYRIFCNFLQLSPNNDDICTYKDAVYNIVFPVYTISTRLWRQALKYAHGNKTYLSYRHILFKQTFLPFMQGVKLGSY